MKKEHKSKSSNIKIRVPDRCRKSLGEYMGRGGPPLFAPLPMEKRCSLPERHDGECRQ